MLDDPAQLRFIVFPIVAIVFGIRDGGLDARAGVKPFDYTLKEFIAATALPFVVITALYIFAMASSHEQVNLLEAAVMGGLCAGVLYAVSRNLSNRLNASQNEQSNT